MIIIWFQVHISLLPYVSRQELCPNQHPTPWVLGGLSPEVKWPGREGGQSSPSSDEADNIWSNTSTPARAFIKQTRQIILLSYIHITPSLHWPTSTPERTYCRILAKVLSLGMTWRSMGGSRLHSFLTSASGPSLSTSWYSYQEQDGWSNGSFGEGKNLFSILIIESPTAVKYWAFFSAKYCWINVHFFGCAGTLSHFLNTSKPVCS